MKLINALTMSFVLILVLISLILFNVSEAETVCDSVKGKYTGRGLFGNYECHFLDENGLNQREYFAASEVEK